MDKYSYIANAHGTYIDELYKQYQQDPSSVEFGWQKFFEGFDFSAAYPSENGHDATTAPSPSSEGTPGVGGPAGNVDKEIKVRNLIYSYRSRGHLRANTNPVRPRKDRKALLDLADFGLSDADLDTKFQSGAELNLGTAPLRDILATLKKVYQGTIGFEFMYIRDPEVLTWFKEKAEKELLAFTPSLEYRKRILSKLNEAVVFENFLHTKFIGQKRFSLEGGETTIPALDAIIDKGAELGVEEVVIGMAHRGRLNVLANIIGKTYEQIFSEFQGTAVPDLTMGDGDVKYHMGFSSEIKTFSGHKVNLKLAPNPSHLEAVNPVVEGFIRAKLDSMYNHDVKKVLPILIHGDAAIAGQGIGYELTQMAKLDGFSTGGTIHFVINNQVGFTTDFEDGRSSIYCTDLAKIIDAPVLHVNGDDPEAVVFAVRLATEYRQKFHNDVFIDMVCYRRHGHNEADEPKFTQPQLYNLISKHSNPREIYNKVLVGLDSIDDQAAEEMDKEFRHMLQERLDMVKQEPLPYNYQVLEKEWQELRRSRPEDFQQSPETGISLQAFEQVGKALSTLPENFKPLKQIEKLTKERHDMFFESKSLNWASAELLAFGSILLDGKIVRMSGQDVQRGTFSHRHAVLHDANTSAPYTNLNHISENQQKFQIYNSLLSEYGVLGFEFGYSMANPNALVIWEAQFGDFANGAQVMIDQFISSTESKWQRMNGVVMLLPHGYEGQGPEHSNARPERFLQLSAEYNMYVTQCTTPANYFHMLRRQLALPFRKPCIHMAPKSMLRHQSVMSPIEDFTKGSFLEVIGDGYADAEKVTKVLLCTGKIYYELLEEQKQANRQDVALIRLEQLHPFPDIQLERELNKYQNVPVYWVQEEPFNMGAWTYILSIMRNRVVDVVSRKPSSSPATGYNKVHQKEQSAIIKKAFSI